MPKMFTRSISQNVRQFIYMEDFQKKKFTGRAGLLLEHSFVVHGKHVKGC